MLRKCVERLVLRINRDLDVLRDRLPLALRACIASGTVTTTITISKTARASRAVTAVAARWPARTIAARTRPAGAITARAATTSKTPFSSAATAPRATVSESPAATTISTLGTIFAVGIALDDFFLLAEIRHPCGHHAQAGQIEKIGLGLVGSAGIGFGHNKGWA
jgi:hypothetical protein